MAAAPNVARDAQVLADAVLKRLLVGRRRSGEHVAKLIVATGVGEVEVELVERAGAISARLNGLEGTDADTLARSFAKELDARGVALNDLSVA